MRTSLALCLTVVILGSASADGYRLETVAEDLVHPWSLAFLPGGDMLVTERGGALKRLAADGMVHPVSGVPQVYVRSQGGLFEIALDPDFESNGLVYLTYAHGKPEANHLRLARATFTDDALHDLQILFESVPAKDTPVHYGGRMTFLPDGTLLLTMGDGFDYREAAQRLDNHLGKTVRLHRDGRVPDDNPFVAQPGALPEIWTYGHRNPQGLAVTAESGDVFLHEHGPRGGDELNLLEPGKNYGWPIITYGLDYSGAYVSPYTEMEGLEQPIIHWTPSIAPAGMALYDGEAFPGWQGDLFVAALVEKSVRRLQMDGRRVIGQQVLFRELDARMREVRVGPDGFLYLLTDADPGRIVRVRPDP